MTKLKAFADDKLNVAEMKISPYDRVEKLLKRRKWWLLAFPSFPTVFSKAFFSVVKSLDCKELTDDKILALSKLKGHDDNKINVSEKSIFDIGWVEHIMGRGNNAVYIY